MAVPVEPDLPTWKWIALGAVSLAQLLFGYLCLGFRDTQKSHGARLDTLERTYVTRTELDKHIEKLEATGQRQHETNTATMERIEEKIDRSSHTRHDIRDSAHATQLMSRQVLEEFRRDRDALMGEFRRDRDALLAVLEKLDKKGD
jgi:hypothetical protein